jgi:hypothetical protein
MLCIIILFLLSTLTYSVHPKIKHSGGGRRKTGSNLVETHIDMKFCSVYYLSSLSDRACCYIYFIQPYILQTSTKGTHTDTHTDNIQSHTG